MEIESVIKRKHGTTIELYGKTYTFAPKDPADPDSPHTCNVDDPDAIQRLMQIPEGFCVPGAKRANVSPSQSAPPPPPTGDGQLEVVTEMVAENEPVEDIQVEEEAGPPPAYLLTMLQLSVPKILKQLNKMPSDDLRALLDLEQRNANRSGVVRAIKAKLK